MEQEEESKRKSQYALVTGATSGIGYELAKLCAQDGYNLIIVARNEERLNEVAGELRQYNVQVLPMAKDLFQPQAAWEIYDDVLMRGLEVEILINDAGQGEWGNFAEVDLQRSLNIIQLNVVSLVSLTKYFLTEMLARKRGRILQLGSEAGKTPMPLLSVYAATKAFVISFSEALTNELKGTDVSVTLLLPGASDTDFFHKANAESTVTYREAKLASAEEVARDGYAAMMKGEGRIISGTQTKIHIMKSNLTSDDKNAEDSRKEMEISKKEPGTGRAHSDHKPSRAERENIVRVTGKGTGDYPASKAKKIRITQKVSRPSLKRSK
jgi:short-subunit dehydrogenase